MSEHMGAVREAMRSLMATPSRRGGRAGSSLPDARARHQPASGQGAAGGDGGQPSLVAARRPIAPYASLMLDEAVAARSRPPQRQPRRAAAVHDPRCRDASAHRAKRWRSGRNVVVDGRWRRRPRAPPRPAAPGGRRAAAPPPTASSVSGGVSGGTDGVRHHGTTDSGAERPCGGDERLAAARRPNSSSPSLRPRSSGRRAPGKLQQRAEAWRHTAAAYSLSASHSLRSSEQPAHQPHLPPPPAAGLPDAAANAAANAAAVPSRAQSAGGALGTSGARAARRRRGVRWPHAHGAAPVGGGGQRLGVQRTMVRGVRVETGRLRLDDGA